MSVHVLDSSAILAYIGGEPGSSVVADLLSNPSATCYAHSINLCEVYYDTVRRTDDKRAKEAILALESDGIIERRDMGRRFWQRVGNLKARGRISIADCFAIVLAQELSGEVVTADHHEFDPLIPFNIVPINFIR